MKSAGPSTKAWTATEKAARDTPTTWTREEVTTLYVVLAITAVVVLFLIFAWALLRRKSHRDRLQVEEEGDRHVRTPRTFVDTPAPPAEAMEPTEEDGDDAPEPEEESEPERAGGE